MLNRNGVKIVLDRIGLYSSNRGTNYLVGELFVWQKTQFLSFALCSKFSLVSLWFVNLASKHQPAYSYNVSSPFWLSFEVSSQHHPRFLVILKNIYFKGNQNLTEDLQQVTVCLSDVGENQEESFSIANLLGIRWELKTLQTQKEVK